MKNTWLVAAVFAAAVAAVAAGCADTDGSGSAPTESDGVRIASFDFAESRLVAELYAQSLEAEGLAVIRLGPIGPREVIAPALEQGHIDLVPEYLGTAARYFGAPSDDVAGLAVALQARDLRPLVPAPAEDVNVFVVTGTTAARHELVRISDLSDVASGFTIGGPVECPDRPYCLLGLETTYGLSFDEFVPTRTLRITADALTREEIDVGVMFSTAAELATGSFVVLEDDRDLQPAENIVPVVRRATIERWGPGLETALNRLSGRLTTADLQAMNRHVEVDEPVADVAGAWLRAAGLT